MTFTQEQNTHHLKIYPEHFSAVLTGVKRAELRKNDRNFKVGDTLHLMETPKGSCNPTGEFVNAVVTHIADVGDWLPGYVLLSIERETAYAATPAPVVPEKLPCPVMLEPGLRFGKGVRTQTMLDALQRRAECSAELEAMTPEQRADHDAGIASFKAMLAPVIPEKATWADAPVNCENVDWAQGWNACRAAMLQGAEPVQEWIPCSARMPEGMHTVITSNGFDIGQGWWDGEEWKQWSHHDAIPGVITHWMPLPAAPQQEAKS